jgi:hypothetical protein
MAATGTEAEDKSNTLACQPSRSTKGMNAAVTTSAVCGYWRNKLEQKSIILQIDLCWSQLAVRMQAHETCLVKIKDSII